MSHKLKHIASEYGTQILIIIAGISLILAINNVSRNHPHELDNAQAPAFILTSLSGGEVNLADKLGQEVIVLDFFATWCPPCVKGLPVLNKVAQEFSDQGVQVYVVNVGEPDEVVRPFMERHKLDLEVLMDPDHTVADRYHVQGIPQTVIIDKHGIIHTVHVGVSSSFENELRRDIQSALQAPPPAEAPSAT